MTILAPMFRNAGPEDPAVPLTSATLLDWLGGPKSASGVTVTEQNSLGIAAVWRAVNLIAGTSASLPLHAYARVGDARTKVGLDQTGPLGRAAQLLDDPHPDMTPMELWELAYGHIALWGNTYLRKLGSPGNPLAELWPVQPSRVRVGRVSDTGRKIYVIDGTEVHYDDTILHIPGFGYDGICGVSPICAAREGLGLAMAAEQYGAKLFGSGSLATGILQTEQRLTSSQADAIQRRWREKRAGLASAHETIVLDRGANFTQLSIPPEDAQFIESRRFQISEIARIFGVPPHMLMDTDKSTSWGTGIEQQSIGFVVFTLRPWLTRVEQRLSREFKVQGAYARYSLEGLLRGDSAQRAAFYQSMWETGAFSINEIRALEDMAPIEGGDVHYRPLNFGPLDAEATTDVAALLTALTGAATSNRGPRELETAHA